MSDVPSLALGGVLGDSDRESMEWSRAIGALSTEFKALREGVDSPVRVNVVFHVDGKMAPNNFEGVRAGRFDRQRSLLIVQAAVADPSASDRRSVLLALLHDAIDEAERTVVRRGLADGLPVIRGLLAAVGA